MSKHPATELRETYSQPTIPATSKISEGIEKTKEAIHEEVAKRSPLAPEQKVGKDTEQLLETTQHFLEEKNKGDVLQKLILDANKSVDELTVLFQKHPFFIEKHKALMAKHEALDLANVARTNMSMMRDLLLTLVNSSEFRGLINDFISLVQEMVQRETSGMPSLTPSTQSNVPLTEEFSQKGEQLWGVAKQVASDVQQGTVPVPEDKKQSIQMRFKSLVRSLSRDPNYINSINGIFQIMDQAQFLIHNIKEEAQGRVQEIQTPSLNAMWLDSKQFLINFAGEAPVNTIITDWNNLYDVIINDTLLMNFMDDFRTFVLDILKNPDMVDSAEFNVRWDDLYMRGQGYLNDPRYNDKFNKVYKDILVLMDSIRMDTTTQQLANDASKLARDLFLDESGKPSLNIMSSGLNNLRSLVGPILKKNLENVPISGLSGEDATYKWRIDHLLINMTNLVPDNIEVRVWGAANVSLQSTEAQAITYITMWIKNVGVEAKDMKFAFQRKSFPKIEDQGVADFSITGRNELKITWKVAGQQNEPWVFSLYQVKCNLDNLDITVKESHHSFLMKLMTTLFRGTIRRNIEDNIEKNVAEGLGTVNDQLNAAVRV